MKAKFDLMCMNCLSKIESNEEVDAVEFQANAGLSQSEISLWESRNSPVRLPKDMRAFYAEFNGFNAPWRVSLKDRPVNIGVFSLKKLEHFTKMLAGIPEPLLASLPFEIVGGSICYVIDTIPDIGDIVMSFSQKSETSSLCITVPSYESAGPASLNNPSTGNSSALFGATAIWFIDESTRQWSYICATFSDYMRLMIAHLGILGWQTAFSSGGLAGTTKEWMCVFAKERLVVDLHNFK